MWKKLPCSFSELNLNITLGGGQSFRWKKMSDGEWRGVISSFVCSLKQDSSGNLLYRFQKSEIENKDSSRPYKRQKKMTPTTVNACSDENLETLLKTYFNMSFKLVDHYAIWSKSDENFKSLSKNYQGIRILKQDPVENLFSFICSANNNIQRITSMVDKLCSNYGNVITEVDDEKYFSFPSVDKLSDDKVEDELRKLGFGYRAKYINQTAKILHKEKPKGWLESLREVPYKEAHDALLTLPGIGAKVADCICLMSLEKYCAIPVDTHIWQVTVKDYLLHLKNAKSLNHKIYNEIGDFYRERFGPYAGWANTVLFAADLKMFKEKKK